MTFCGYDNQISIANLKEADLDLIDNYLNRSEMRAVIDSLSCCKSEIYKAQEKFELLPGHRTYILNLARQMILKQMSHSDMVASTTPGLTFKEQAEIEPSLPFLLKEFINISLNNYKKMPNSHRYSNIIQDFATYIYILCGRYCYEVISKNLPMPKAPTICKHGNLYDNTHEI